MGKEQSPYPTAKTIPATQVRFVPRPHKTGPRTTTWEVYDKSTGSVGNLRFGTPVKQDHKTEALAQAECDRLEGLR